MSKAPRGEACVTPADLGEEVGHHAVVHHRALRPFGRAVAMRVQRAAVVVPAGKVVSEQEVRQGA